MKVIIFTIITLIFINVSIYNNYAFAENNLPLKNINNKELNQDSKQNIQCKSTIRCDNQSEQQQQQQQQQQKTRQKIDCNVNAKCTNYSTSNIVVCTEHSVCLLQYEGPFQMVNPY
jgi:transcription initiation factor TFIID subunit TAF12